MTHSYIDLTYTMNAVESAMQEVSFEMLRITAVPSAHIKLQVATHGHIKRP